jgi:Histone acetyltransferase subunit NuA4
MKNSSSPHLFLLLFYSLQGFEGFLVSKNAQARNKNRTFRLEDRAFSLSSYTSQAERDQQAQRDQYAAEQAYGGRGKGGGGAYGGVKGVAGVIPSKRGY